MNFELFIANRIVSSEGKSFSRPLTRIAILSIVLGLSVMIISLAIVTGFQKQIREKLIGFGGHIQITRYDSNISFETSPVSKNQDFYPSLTELDGIAHIQVFAVKAGIIKTTDQMEGVLLKGIGSDFDGSFFEDKIIDGNLLSINDSVRSDDILISRKLADRLLFSVGDDLRMYFIIGDQTRGRKFNVCGIYETGLEDFDSRYVICDIAHIQKLNGWENDQVTGFEVFIDDFDEIDRMGQLVYDEIGYDLDALTIKQIYPQMFDWLALQDMNVIIILVLMVMVAGITMISILLILILERTQMIGILKALGMRDWSIRKIFLYNAVYLIGYGLLFGNILGLCLSLIQQKWGIVKLAQESYYVSVVPINLEFFPILLINAGTLIVCLAMLILPSYIVTKITPVKAIRFE